MVNWLLQLLVLIAFPLHTQELKFPIPRNTSDSYETNLFDGSMFHGIHIGASNYHIS